MTCYFFFLMIRRPPRSTLFPYNDALPISDFGSGLNYKKKGLTRLIHLILEDRVERLVITHKDRLLRFGSELVFSLCEDRKSTRLNSSHANISYAVFCLKKKNTSTYYSTCH